MNYCIVIPYRNREAHLKKFIRHYHNMLGVDIYVIEQADDHHFNRGKLANVGFLEFAHKYDYFIFHDVDMYIFDERYHVMDKKMKKRLHDPRRPIVFYGDKGWNEGVDAYTSYPECPVIMATHCSQFDFKMPYNAFMGGVTMFSTADFRRFGGFRNDIWSWGNEDDALYLDIVNSGLKIEKRDCWYLCEEHPREIVKEHFKAGRRNLLEPRGDKDNVWNCEYRVISTQKFDKYTLISVSLQE